VVDIGNQCEDTPKISAIVTTRNRPQLLGLALESVLEQSEQGFELIVVDDASDPPAAVAADPRIHLVRLDVRSGVSKARNAGISAATAPLLCFLDDDDMMTVDRLRIACEHAADPVTVCAAGTIGTQRTTVHRFSGDVSATIASTTTPHLGCVSVQAAIAPRFDARFTTCEDVDWLIRLASAQPFVSDDRVGWLWRRHDAPRIDLSTAARLDGSLLLLDVHRQYFRQHRPAASFRWFRVAAYAQQTGRRRQAVSAALRSAVLHPMPRSLWRTMRICLNVRRSPATTGSSAV
jgi:glycosyltransferase involved in cell wall biosynthesis